MHPARVFRWSDLPTDRPMPLIERQRVVGEKAMISRVTLEKGFTLASHHHENEQFVVMLSGRARFGVGREGTPEHLAHTLATGDVLLLPPNVPHSVVALEPCVILDLFAPPSERTGVDHPPRAG